jgi:hypothetical protein
MASMGMNHMIEDGVMGISNKNNRVWLKILKHNGNVDLEPYKGFVDYKEITNFHSVEKRFKLVDLSIVLGLWSVGFRTTTAFW